jgi:hypothetical protein
LKPEKTHTFWDPEKGRYVTIPAEAVIKPPTDDEQTAHKAVVAVDAVVSSAMRSFGKGLAIALGIFLLIAILSGVKDDGGIIPGVFLVFVFAYLAYAFVRAATKKRP